jgi:FixJ family two-component response regulator
MAQSVYVVDDSSDMRDSVAGFLRVSGLSVETFGSARAFLSRFSPALSGCLVLDVHMPEMSGIELQETLVTMRASLPVIVVSGNAAIADVVRTMKLGSLEFIEKPYSPKHLLECVHEALRVDLRRREEGSMRAQAQACFARLTERERQIVSLVVAGRPSKLIAGEMGLTVSTIDNHRAKIMKKLRAETAADLARIALLADPALAFPRGK